MSRTLKKVWKYQEDTGKVFQKEEREMYLRSQRRNSKLKKAQEQKELKSKGVWYD